MKKIPEARDNLSHLAHIMKNCFDYYDKDKIGVLSGQQTENLLNDITNTLDLPKLDNLQMASAFKIIDENGDGVIEFNEQLDNIGKIYEILTPSISTENPTTDLNDAENDLINRPINNPNFINRLGKQIKLFEKLRRAQNPELYENETPPEEFVESLDIINNDTKKTFRTMDSMVNKEITPKKLSKYQKPSGGQSPTKDFRVNKHKKIPKHKDTNLEEEQQPQKDSILFSSEGQSPLKRQFSKSCCTLEDRQESPNDDVEQNNDSYFSIKIKSGDSPLPLPTSKVKVASKIGNIQPEVNVASFPTIEELNKQYIDNKVDLEEISMFKKRFKDYQSSKDKMQFFAQMALNDFWGLLRMGKTEKNRFRCILLYLDKFLSDMQAFLKSKGINASMPVSECLKSPDRTNFLKDNQAQLAINSNHRSNILTPFQTEEINIASPIRNIAKLNCIFFSFIKKSSS